LSDKNIKCFNWEHRSLFSLHLAPQNVLYPHEQFNLNQKPDTLLFFSLNLFFEEIKLDETLRNHLNLIHRDVVVLYTPED
jgi:hypothetical protein